MRHHPNRAGYMPARPSRLLIGVIATILATLPPRSNAMVSLSHVLHASSLHLMRMCAVSVAVVADQSLQQTATVEATAESADELSHLRFVDGPAAAVKNIFKCNDPPYSLAVVIHVSPGLPVSITDGGWLDYRLDTPASAVAAQVGGSGTLSTTAVGSLWLAADGGMQVHVGEVDKQLALDLAGQNRVVIQRADVDSASIVSHGGSHVAIEAGTIRDLRFRAEGMSASVIDARVDGGALELAGSNRISLSNASKNISVRQTGMNRIEARE